MTPRTGASRLNVDAEDVGRGLAGLVVALLDLLRQVLERQALRRVDAGDLTDDEIEKLGQALLALEDGFAELQDKLGLAPGDIAVPLDIADLDDAMERAAGLVNAARDEGEAT
jgi:hypothetical protein